MRRSLYLGLVALVIMGVAAVAFGAVSKLDLKVGEEIYACNCGEACPCLTLSRAAGKCACNKDLVKAKVVKVEKDLAYLKADKWEKPRPFKTVGKYACACGPECKCDTISQQPGKCTCGKEMKEVK